MENGATTDAQRNDTKVLVVGSDESLSCVPDPSADGESQLIVSEKTVTVSAVIMSIGLVSALHLFVWLAVLHPDAANTLIPVIFVAIGNLTWKICTKGKKK